MWDQPYPYGGQFDGDCGDDEDDFHVTMTTDDDDDVDHDCLKCCNAWTTFAFLKFISAIAVVSIDVHRIKSDTNTWSDIVEHPIKS